MRIYNDFPEALNEIKRDLAEMGILVHPKSVQNLDVANDPDYETHELQCYSYLVSKPDWREIPLRSPEWMEAEFKERICGQPLNPGWAWLQRESYWKTFLRPDKKFDYTYPERLSENLSEILDLLREDINTRRAFLPVFNGYEDDVSDLTTRIPCTLGYWFYYRQGTLNITYLQRSSDFFEHFNYDVALADRLKCYIASELKVEPGTFCHVVLSLHCFARDVSKVF